MVAPPIQYARAEDGVNIAFWTLGQGQPLIEQSQSPYSHCEAFWRSHEATRWFTRFAAGRQLVYLDHRGQGLSDRGPGDFSPTLVPSTLPPSPTASASTSSASASPAPPLSSSPPTIRTASTVSSFGSPFPTPAPATAGSRTCFP